MATVSIIGLGALGRRHLQALAKVSNLTKIYALDISETALLLAKNTIEQDGYRDSNKISFTFDYAEIGDCDIAIIATCADVRRDTIENLLKVSNLKFLILEKLLFCDLYDYEVVSRLLKRKKIRAFVNCPMRIMPVYRDIYKKLSGETIFYRVTGSQYGMVTNAIHYLDHVAHISGCNDFILETDRLDLAVIKSKRAGFSELTGTLSAKFSNGSYCEVSSLAEGDLPVVVDIFSKGSRYIVRETEQKMFYSDRETGWQWVEREAVIPYQSQMTIDVIKELIVNSRCELTTFEDALVTHLQLLKPIYAHLQRNEIDISISSFT